MSVYFARVKGYVKIGYSSDVFQRLNTIAAGKTLRPNDVHHRDRVDLLGVLPGDRARERTIHHELSRHWVIGEWFWFVPQVEAHAANDPQWMDGYEYSPTLEALMVEDGLTKAAALHGIDVARRAHFSAAGLAGEDVTLADGRSITDWYRQRDAGRRAFWRNRAAERVVA